MITAPQKNNKQKFVGVVKVSVENSIGSRGMDPDPYQNVKDPQQCWKQNLVIQLEGKLILSRRTEVCTAIKKRLCK
jgi:hypothetical protein